ncbi:MAG TPA: citrate lyase subunit beta [Thiothrix sp.]|nr:citrate lyase subunit beta [Thiothrix sp.]
MLSPFQLGATLYMPATRTDLFAVMTQQKISDLRSMVICFEDAIREDEVEAALANFQQLLDQLCTACSAAEPASHPLGSAQSTSNSNSERERASRPLVFVRPRYPAMAAQLCQMTGIEQINGFVLPKFDNHSFAIWEDVLQVTPKHFVFMPTLETVDILDLNTAKQLRDKLLNSALQQRILVLRIGGNDLMACYGLRRHHQHTLYDTPLGYIIAQLVTVFIPAGFALTAPVFEYFQDNVLLEKEWQQDLRYGLVGKTAIHPKQIIPIQQALKVDIKDYAAAKRILAQNAPAVFQFNGAMCEPSTHRRWAEMILQRAAHFGCQYQSIGQVLDCRHLG